MKKFIRSALSVLLVSVLSLSCLFCASARAESGKYIPGDVDGSGIVDAADARLSLRAAIALETFSDERIKTADVTGDGKVTPEDSRLILRFAVKLITSFTSQQLSATVWTETAIPAAKTKLNVDNITPFDLGDIVTGRDNDYGCRFNTYIFRGQVVSAKNYDISWTDEDGTAFGPYQGGVLEVKVSKSYYGKSPAGSDDTVRVYYPASLASEAPDSVRIEAGTEYVFVTWLLDDVYTQCARRVSPQYRGEEEKHADVVLTSTFYKLMSVVDGRVVLYNGYFSGSPETMQKALTPKASDEALLTSSGMLANKTFIVMSAADFDSEFSALLAKY